jgi:hypothetical protein
MKTFALVAVHLVTALLLLLAGCASPVKNKLQGDWTSKDGNTKLKITPKNFAMDKDAEIQEVYFVKGDTIFTSYEGNRPYTKFVIQKLEDNELTLLDPDSALMVFTRY